MKKLFLVPFLAILFVAGTANAQVNNLPSPGITPASPFYFLDRIGEAIREFVAFNPEAKARLQVTFAAERIAEIKIILETKGIGAKGLDVAQARLQENIARAATVIEKQKARGKDVSELAKNISDGFDSKKDELKLAFKTQKQKLKAEEKNLKAQIQEARQAGDTAQSEALLVQIDEIKTQKKLLKREKEDQEDALEHEEERIKKEVEERYNVEKIIRKAKEEKQELVEDAEKDGVNIPADAFVSFDALIAQAETLFNIENYQEAKRLAKQAEDILEDIEDVIEEIEEGEEDSDEGDSEDSAGSEDEEDED